jgi:hypothetical protein
MIEVNAWLFWGICAMAAIGFLQAVASIAMKPETKDWTKPTHAPPGEAPEGFAWALVRIKRE